MQLKRLLVTKANEFNMYFPEHTKTKSEAI